MATGRTLFLIGLAFPVLAAESLPALAQEKPLRVPESVVANRVSCGWRGCRFLAARLFGPAATMDSAQLVLAKWGEDTLNVTRLRMMAVGDVTEALLFEPLDTLIPLPHHHALGARIPLGALASIGADRYSGELRVWLEDEDTTEGVTVPFTLYVRNGPIPVLVTLLAGLLIGRLLLRINEAGSPGKPRKPRGIERFRPLAGFRWGGGKPPARGTRLLAAVSGVAWPSLEGPESTEQDRMEGEFRTRAGAAILVLAVALYQGFKVLYLNDPTFGDGGFLDMAAVFVWAFAADGGQRFLANFRWLDG